MRITSPKLHRSHTTANEDALLRCEYALELKDKGDYQGVQETMAPLWKRVGERPGVENLHAAVAAEVLLCVGVLTGWIGSKNDINEAQEVAKNLLTESTTYFEGVGDIKKVAAARAEIAYCYWREGEFDEARIMLIEAIRRLSAEGPTKARALLRLAIVEWSTSRHEVALKILTDNAPIFKKVTNHTIRGTYHNQLALVLRSLAVSEKRDEYFQQAIREYEQADHYFKLAHHTIFRADVKNNLAFLLLKLSRFRKAYECLDQARRLTVSLKDKIGIAQIDDTRAQILIGERKFKEAEKIARHAVRVFEKSGRQCLLTDALITHAIALARLKQKDRAQFTFQRAIEIAHQVGALNKAGLAALTMLEEIDDLSPGTLCAAYDRASDWLASSQSQDLLVRLNAAARKVFLALRGELNAPEATDAILNKPFELHNEVLKFEGSLIKKALAQVNGSVTRAASLLGMSYQGLAYVIDSRHKDLLNQRSPVRRRSTKARTVSEE